MTAEEGYFIKSLDPDGTRHGVYGATKHNYFEAAPNHDAICFRIADDAQAERIYAKIASIGELRRNDLIVANAPSLDDMYEKPVGLWEYGRWVNGGHWSTAEARMILGYYRLGKYEDARKSMKRILDYFRRFRTDNPLVNFGGDVYQPNEPINCVYDTWGVPAAMIRGLFEYLYRADRLVILPHVPPGIVELQQRFPVRFGRKRLFLATIGSGPIRGVTVNGEKWSSFDKKSVTLPYEPTPEDARIQILLGGAKARSLPSIATDRSLPAVSPVEGMAAQMLPKKDLPGEIAKLDARVSKLHTFYDRLTGAGLENTYEAAHARLAVLSAAACGERFRLLSQQKIERLPEASQHAADRSYLMTAARLCEGLEKVLRSYRKAEDLGKRRIFALWDDATSDERDSVPSSK